MPALWTFFHCNQKPGGLRHTKSDSVQACSCSCLTWIHSDTSFWFITPWHMRDLSWKAPRNMEANVSRIDVRSNPGGNQTFGRRFWALGMVGTSPALVAWLQQWSVPKLDWWFIKHLGVPASFRHTDLGWSLPTKHQMHLPPPSHNWIRPRGAQWKNILRSSNTTFFDCTVLSTVLPSFRLKHITSILAGWGIETLKQTNMPSTFFNIHYWLTLAASQSYGPKSISSLHQEDCSYRSARCGNTGGHFRVSRLGRKVLLLFAHVSFLQDARGGSTYPTCKKRNV